MAVDPSTVLGSWDEVLFIPTNSTVGALTTGVGECHTHPHSSNLLTDGWLQSYYGNQWGVAFNGTTTKIDCGSNAGLDNLADNAFTAEAWYKNSDSTTINTIFNKGNVGSVGWLIQINTSVIYAYVYCANTNANTIFTMTNGSLIDNKWHHIAMTFDDAGTRLIRIWIDGVEPTPLVATAGVGAIVDDAAGNLWFGCAIGSVNFWKNTLGWCRISNNIRYTTNFKPSRTIPVADANTLAQWAVDEGTGATLNSTGTLETAVPGSADGTITAGTWQPQWYAEGTPIVPTSVASLSSSFNANVGSGASIDNLHDGAMTIDGWVRLAKVSGVQYIAYKGDTNTTGWNIYATGGTLVARVYCATSGASAISTGSTYNDNRWHYFKVTFDDAGDRKPYIYWDNVLIGQTQVAGVDAVVSDAATDGFIGKGSNSLQGAHGWIRWSNVVRGAGMISRSTPPDPADANTMLQFNADTGYGATLTDMSGEGNHGTLAAGIYSWINTGALDLDSPGARVYGWGKALGSDAVNEGIKQTFTGLTAGANYVIRALAYSEDGVGIPRVVVYDETNAAAITALTGLATSTEWAPDVLLFSFELPTNARGAAADCTSMSIQLISTTAGNVGWHQVELYANLLDNPSLDVGAVADPWIPYGWVNNGFAAGESEIEVAIRHSEGSSLQVNNTAAGRYIAHPVFVLAAGKYVGMGWWRYNSAALSLSRFQDLTGFEVKRQDSLTLGIILQLPASGAAWTHLKGVGRNTAANPWDICNYFDIDASGAQRYADDLYMILLDDVTLTVTPASQANSLEGTGIRGDGYDLLSTPTAGEMSANWWYAEVFITPRHSDATVALFGIATPCWIEFRYNAANTIVLDWSAANTLRFRVISNGTTYTGTWATGGGAVLAGTKYLVKIERFFDVYNVYINGMLRISLGGVVPMAFYPIIAYWGMDNARAYNSDIVVSSY